MAATWRIHGWDEVVYYTLFGGAICAASATEEATRFVDDYRVRFGMSAIVDVLARPTEVPSVDPAQVLAATSALRGEVISLAVRALTTEIPYEEWADTSALNLARYLDEDLWARLRREVQHLLDSGSATQGAPRSTSRTFPWPTARCTPRKQSANCSENRTFPTPAEP
ncbi:hypothetical protein ACNJ7E_38115 [Rhodococcus sp. NM-2]|uniref:hypothetical protein n=1 Tax=Rhodococcus sp. NM-2 TaxID=3401174 RepID=UPI003AACEADE